MSLDHLKINLLELEALIIQFNLPNLKCLSEDNHELFCLVEKVGIWCQQQLEDINSKALSLSSNVGSPDSTISISIKAGMDRIWEILNTGTWKDVPEYIKHIYTLMSYYRMVDLLTSVPICDWTLKFVEKCIHILDKGLLLGYNNLHISRAMENLMDIYNSLCLHNQKKLEDGISQIVSDSNSDGMIMSTWKIIDIQGTPVKAISSPSLLKFQSDHLWTREPVKLTDCVAHWPALNRWSLQYFRQLAGPRLVPIELGKKYTDEDWSQRLMSLNQFLDNHMSETSHAYLAQHDLLTQIPQLKRDICIPDYCYLHTDEKNMKEDSCDVDLNIWFGPPGTVTPFHWDAKHNLLVQVLGSKRVLLTAPECNMYPYEGLLNNTSPVDPEIEPELLAREFPDFVKYPVQECILQPGDMLYIPPQYWHHVRSLSTSISVSFWFE